MSLGERIKRCRQNVGLSQEKIAELVGVSRQAVTKWERNQSAPSTENLFKLAEIFGTTVDMLLDLDTDNKQTSLEQFYNLRKLEKETEKINEIQGIRKKLKRPFIIITILGCILGSVLYVHNLPIDYDAGACSGGYATFIFDKYNAELVEKYYNGSANKSDISSVKAIRGTHEATWEDKTLFLNFEIQYEHSIKGIVTERVRFIGHRIWFDTYKWSGAIIEIAKDNEE